jgi:site-specific DNA recombinase
MKYLKVGFSFLQNVDTYYQNTNLESKRKIVGSIFEEKLIYENSILQTQKMNEVVSLILQEDNILDEMKNGIESKSMMQSRAVVPTGIEPVSKV